MKSHAFLPKIPGDFARPPKSPQKMVGRASPRAVRAAGGEHRPLAMGAAPAVLGLSVSICGLKIFVESPLHFSKPGVFFAANLKPTKAPPTKSHKNPPPSLPPPRHRLSPPTPLSPSTREFTPPNQGNPKTTTFPRAPVLRPAKLRLHIRLSVPSVPLWQNQTQKPCKNAHFPSGTNRHQAPGVRPSPGAETCIDRNHHIPK